MGPPQSGQPLTSVQQIAHLPRRTNTSQLQTTDTDQPLKYLSQYKIAFKNGQESYTYMPVDRFVPPPLLDSKTKHYIRTVVHCASLLCQCKATESIALANCKRKENYQDVAEYNIQKTLSVICL